MFINIFKKKFAILERRNEGQDDPVYLISYYDWDKPEQPNTEKYHDHVSVVFINEAYDELSSKWYIPQICNDNEVYFVKKSCF